MGQGTVETTRPDFGSMRMKARVSAFGVRVVPARKPLPTDSAPPANAISVGVSPDANVLTTRRVRDRRVTPFDRLH